MSPEGYHILAPIIGEPTNQSLSRLGYGLTLLERAVGCSLVSTVAVPLMSGVLVLIACLPVSMLPTVR